MAEPIETKTRNLQDEILYQVYSDYSLEEGSGNQVDRDDLEHFSIIDKDRELFDSQGMPTSTLYRQKSAWWYPRSYSAMKNTVITFPSFQNDIWRLDPRGDGSVKSVATVPGPAFKKEAPATMFDSHKILAIQGVQEAVVLDISNPNAPTFEKTGQLREKRFWANSVSLRNGEDLVVGCSGVSQQLDTTVKYAEIWNPTTCQWRVAANAVKARLYHSTSILLPDATVLVGGGGR
jgi:hypothetical protein